MTTEPDKVPHNFFSDKEFSDWLRDRVYESGRNKSEFMRTCIALSGETVCANPVLCELTKAMVFKQR